MKTHMKLSLLATVESAHTTEGRQKSGLARMVQRAWTSLPLLNPEDFPLRDLSSLPQHNSRPLPAIQVSSTPPTQQQSLHIMACMQKTRYRKNLCQERLDAVSTDRELFAFLNTQFKKRRGALASKLSLRAIQGIFFIKVRHYVSCKRRL